MGYRKLSFSPIIKTKKLILKLPFLDDEPFLLKKIFLSPKCKPQW